MDRPTRTAARGRSGVAALAAVTIAAALAAASADDNAAAQQAGADGSTPTPARVTVTEGTNLNAAAAPDGSVVVDLHGMLYQVPAGGGDAERLTDPLLEVAQPDVAADGRLAFQSYADGRFHIWVAEPDGSNPRQLTSGGFDDREPRWSPDGEHIAFSSDRGGSYDVWSVEVATGELTRWTTDAGEQFEPSWSPDGDEIVHVDDNQIAVADQDGPTRTLIAAPAPPATVHAPSFSPDGERVAYVQREGTAADLMVDGEPVSSGEDVFLFAPEWIEEDRLLYTGDGGIRTRELDETDPVAVPFSAVIDLPGEDYAKKEHDFDDRRTRLATILTPQLSPDARSVAFVALNDLWLMPIGGEPERLTDDDFQEVNPVFSPDGTKLAYSSDRAGTEDIYIRDLGTGVERRVTALDSAEVSAAFSPDGSRLAFQDHVGATYILDLSTGGVRELVPSLFGPGRPTWSADGSTIAFAAVNQYSRRFREGVSHILTVDVATGAQRFHSPGDRHGSISTRGDDGPVWSPDGSAMAFVVDSTLRVMPVAGDGSPTGPPRELNGEVADAPSWSGDSSKLLYLSNGRLRLADATTGIAETIAVPLRFRPEVATGRTVIHAGAFWDGEATTLRRDVDITVTGNRITDISPHQPHRHAAGVIDASDMTVMPGLTDAHVHQAYESRFYGDRQGRISLAYGITSTLSVGDQVYRALEDRDALDAGARVGPRFYATGEPIDGSRIYYNFMRPTSSDAQVDLELSRPRQLDYDFLKTYVRLPAKRMQRVVDAAHQLGVPSASHYLTPGALVGQDGTTHLAATQRLGYARTITPTGNTYADVPALYGQGNRSVTTTLFTTDFLLADEMASDPRLRLLPPWERASLVERIADNTAPPSDPDCVSAACKEAQTLDRIQQAGGQVLVGTDSPLDNVGIGVHANLRELVGYGWQPYEALRASILNPARHLGVADDVGTLAEGKVADMIAVDGNPLEDIDAVMDVQWTMVAGQQHTIAELLAPFTGPDTGAANEGPAIWDAADVATEITRHASPRSSRKYWWHDPDYVAEQYAHACDAYETLEHQASWAGDGHRHEPDGTRTGRTNH